jgi:hypothetical protein
VLILWGKTSSGRKEMGDDGMPPKDDAVEEAYDEGKLSQGVSLGRGCAGWTAAAYDRTAPAVGVMDAQEEQSEGGEEGGDQALVSMSHKGLFSREPSDNNDDAVKNCKELTLE